MARRSSATRKSDHRDPRQVSARALHRQGLRHLGAGRLAEARTALAGAVAADATNSAAQNALGVVMMQSGEAGAASSAFRRAAELSPNFADARTNLGNALCMSDEFDSAMVEFRRALATLPGSPEATLGLAYALEHTGRLDEAADWLERLIGSDPANPIAHNNLGNVLIARTQRAAALDHFARAIELMPGYADAHANMALALAGLNRPQEAIAGFDRALELNPGHWDAAFSRALAQLSIGAFAEGWRGYLIRDAEQKVGDGLHRAPLPESLAGKHVFIRPDQGLGDEIVFLRFVPALKARGARVSYRPGRKIATLVARLDTLDHVIGPDVADPAADFVVSVCDLPYLLGHRSIADIPPSIRIAPLAERLAHVGAALAQAGPPPYAGVTWRAGTTHRRRGLYKAAPLAGVARTLADFPGTVIALQRRPADGEVAGFAEALGRPVGDFTAINDDLEAALALLSLVDDYVCVSNTNVHLRAAVGRRCRVLVPTPPEFRWMAASVAPRESPWFPGSAVYRQQADGGWDEPLARLTHDIRSRIDHP